MNSLDPLQVALHPNPDQSEEQYCHEYEKFGEGQQPLSIVDKFLKDGRDRENKGDLNVEDKKDKCNDIKTWIKLNPCFADRPLAALVNLVLVGVGVVRPDQFAKGKHAPDKDEGEGKKHQDGNKIQCHGMVV